MEERDGVLYVKNVEPLPVAAAPAAGAPAASGSGAPYGELIRQAAERHALAPELVESVIRVESNFEPRAVSPKGVMPATSRLLAVHNVFGVRQNVAAACGTCAI